MKQLFQNLRTGEILLQELPVPSVPRGCVLVRSCCSVVSRGTERMLLDFGRAGWIGKALQQPEKVRQVWEKLRTDGVAPTVRAVFSKLDEPIPLGYSSAGVVVETGEGVESVRPGDRVACNGNHGEVVCIPENLCALIPEGVSDESASFTVVGAIALQGIRLLGPQIGESVAVLGLGLIGLLTCQVLRANGCRVIGFDYNAQRVSLAKQLGVEAVVLEPDGSPVSAATHFSSGHGVDGVLITAATQSNDPIEWSAQMCRKRGRIVLVGVSGLQLKRADFYEKELTFQVSCSYGPGRYDAIFEKKGLDYPIGFVRWTERRNFEAILQLMRAGQLVTQPLVSARVPFSDAGRRYAEVLQDSSILGVVFEYDGRVDVQTRTVSRSGPAPVRSIQHPVIGLIGAGNFARAVLAPTLHQLGASLRTIASSSGMTGGALFEKYGSERNTTDERVVMSDSEIDAVVISTPHSSHARLVCDALRAGKHVFVEKPLALTFEELDAVKQCAEEHRDLILMVGFNRRYSPLALKVRELLQHRTQPLSIIITINAGALPPGHWINDSAEGGGRIVGEACHFIDLCCALTDEGVSTIYGTAVSSDTASLCLKLSGGSIATVHYFSNGNKQLPKERVEVFSEGRVLVIDNFRTLRGFGWSSFRKLALREQDKGHVEELRRFLRAVGGEATDIPPLGDLLGVSRAAIAAQDALTKGEQTLKP